MAIENPIQVEITDLTEFHCFKLILNPRSGPGQRIEVMFHARALVELIHDCSAALCAWQRGTTVYLLEQKTGLSSDELRKAGLIAPTEVSEVNAEAG